MLRRRSDFLSPIAVNAALGISLAQDEEAARDLAFIAACRDDAGPASYLLAVAYARKGLVDDALDALKAAADAGDAWADQAKGEKVLDEARKSPRWAAIEKEATKK